ncbi:MAG TPA: contact-dependent growth inhibition system immunity protein [Ktedonobacterales bacterium]|nr:contact-dependent growth inhibition system immunity protein [Ktedonobacterales bacterium]
MPVQPYDPSSGVSEEQRNKTLQELEGKDWGEPTFPSHLVTTCHALRRKPLRDFTVEDLRIMIGQNFSLDYLMPLAIEQLQRDPLVAGDFYPGDLLRAVLRVESGFWRAQPLLRGSVQEIVDQLTPFPESLHQALLAFQHPQDGVSKR